MRPFACDGVVIMDGRILLIRRAKQPFMGEWALPGGRIDENESAEECLRREMREETGLEVEPLSLVGVYSDPGRDPRKIIAATYLCKIIGGKERAGDDAGGVGWFDLNNMPKLASDHGKMVSDALRLLRK